jgi:hypothetical protein
MSESIEEVERWSTFELAVHAPISGNPFTDADFGAVFTHGHRGVEVDGFYDGDETFRVRFMPDVEGEWRYETRSNVDELAGRTGSFNCTPATGDNHGPVRVADRYHFAYEDGTPFYQVGTTCYAWVHQGTELEEQTLETLRDAPFNKLRMCVFPKDYTYNRNEPELYAFQRTDGGEWDFTRFDPVFWQHLEKRVGQLRELGVEADIILFHPYDGGRWGFDRMDAETDDRYLRYAVARLAAFRNVWWSMANEFDIMSTKSMSDWDRFFRVVQESDPYQHLRSVHNCREFYDHGKPWVTHCSVQSSDLDRVRHWRERYGKPVVVDECCYEGNVRQNWGNISARELVHRFWLGTVGGGYVGHGETYLHPDDILWWSKGGVLHGDSPPRIAFLKDILEDGPQSGFEPVPGGVAKGQDYYLFYFGVRQPAEYAFELPEEHEYEAEIIDPWEMTVGKVQGTFSGEFVLELPGRPYLAVRMRKV